ncbi:MAG: hypothetical protein J3K34DRAFT_462123 [Monoraphidium minutum]|nr:MAG: hypothetical protein J3K34DRAFT_462123 [Monoraphidium minutum]
MGRKAAGKGAAAARRGAQPGDDDDDDPDFQLGGDGSARRAVRGAKDDRGGGGGGAPPLVVGGGGVAGAIPLDDDVMAQIVGAGPQGVRVWAPARARRPRGEGVRRGATPLDDDVMAQIVGAGLQGTSVEHLVGADGEQIPALALDEEHLQQLAAAGAIPLAGPDGLVAPLQPLQPQHHLPAAERVQMDGIRRGDEQALQAAKRAGTLISVNFTVDTPEELDDVDVTGRCSRIQVPQSCDVGALKRYIMYTVPGEVLVPGLQVLITDEGEVMLDRDPQGGGLVPISGYGVRDGSHITLRVEVPEDVDSVPLVEEAIVSSAFGGGRGGGRKTRWTQEQIEALIEGVERHGLSAWRTIVADLRLGGKNNMQCKDKFRNLCLTIIQGRPERGLTLDPQLKERVRCLIDQESIKF